MKPEGGTTFAVCRNCDHTAWWHDGVRCHWSPPRCACAEFLAGPGPYSPDADWRLTAEGYVIEPLSNEGTL